MKSETELSTYLATTFPQLAPFDRFIGKNTLKQFIDRQEGEFPTPQHVNTLATVCRNMNAGIVLLGDAAHVFPPDIGQVSYDI